MDKQTLVKGMKEYSNGAGFINKSQIARYLGWSRRFIPDLVDGLDKLPGAGRVDQYCIPDVAQRILDSRNGDSRECS